MNSSKIEHQYLQTNGITLHAIEAGPENGPLMILLHGFPEFWYGWRHQIEALAAAGYRVLAPDQRGYNLSDKPKGIVAYNLDALAADVMGLIDASGRDKASIVGHDWGGAVAWWTAVKYPQRVEKLAILNAPHPKVMRWSLLRNRAQRRKSWYFFFFQIPFLPEWRMRRADWEIGQRALQGTSRPGTFSEADLVLYREAWSQPGAATGMINWYRAALQRRPARVTSSRVTVPALIIWGTRDKFLGRELAQQSVDLCENGRLVWVEGASHWVQHEEPQQVNDLLEQFFVAEPVMQHSG
ncbi:MAG: alpha/beta hydrolase [candidate division KSB1 bacterium]|nr:alpha/beta hydrolase [candidate division KSB1 bacterium]MDZ7369485.1 alpha/beta hydrolase [candidate division KSB1 bacterium]MDZ7407584.1 alpha/beta hydrolase [candidate division KSB1 bacterium]